jgi:two-component system, OmpR family, alkaline phosphatase synthesis response regulator PhoP
VKSILFADDQPAIRLLLSQTLEDFEELGVKIISAENGLEAYELIKKHHPNLVFMDVMMPFMNGYEVFEKMKSELPELFGENKTYVVILTAQSQETDREKGFKSGVDMYVIKPFDPDFIVDIASKVLMIDLKNKNNGVDNSR